MPTADYSSYHQIPGSGADGTKLDNFIDAVQATVNGLDNNNIAVSAGIVLSKLSGPYAAYTPAWTSTGTQPALGNGTIAGSYVQIGKLVQGSVTLTLGSTTTFGTGTYLFSLPVALAAGFAGSFPVGVAMANHAGSVYMLTAIIGSTTTVVLATAASPAALAGPTIPATFASADFVQINFTYQAA